MFIQAPNGSLFMEGQKEDDLYVFELEKNVKRNERSNLLLADSKPPHTRTQRLIFSHLMSGHQNLELVPRYKKDDLIDLSIFPNNVTVAEIKALSKCDACMLAKFTSVRRRGRKNPRPTTLGYHMVTDMKGSFQIASLRGDNMYQGFQDVHSKYLVHFCNKGKTVAAQNLRVACKEDVFENLKSYQADGALELLSKEIVLFWREKDVRMLFTPPYKHSGNYFIERNHRTVFEMAHAMLLQANVATIFYCFAIDEASYLYNRLPTNTAEGLKPPIYVAYGVRLNLDNENILRCVCWKIIQIC